MKNFFSASLAITSLALFLAVPSIHAKDRGKDKKGKKEHRNDRHDDDRDDRRDNRSNYHRNDRKDVSYRSRYPRRVIVYENRSYGYNYYDLQTTLRREGYYRGPIDGVWGPGSRSALVRYQTHRGWRDDGEVDGRMIINFGLGY